MRARIYGMEGTTLGTVDLAAGVTLRDLAKRARRFELFFDAEPAPLQVVQPPAAEGLELEARPLGLELDEQPAPFDPRPLVLEATVEEPPAAAPGLELEQPAPARARRRSGT